jgi:flagellin-like protein
MNFKKFRKFRRNVKAISPVISVLLMIAVAVVASLVVYAWVMGYVGFQTAKTGQAIQIQSISYSNSTAIPPVQTLKVYVQNVGQAAIKVDANSVYVNGTRWALTPDVLSINPGATATFSLQGLPTAVGSGSELIVKVTSLDGTYSQVTQTLP